MINKTQNFRGISSRRSLLLIVVVVAFVVSIDQYTKQLILQHLSPGDRISLIPGIFDLALTFNKGAAFGLLAEMPGVTRQLLLALSTMAALAAVFYFLIKDYFDDWLGQSALALIIGGAFGNILDRLRHGAVVDFLDLYYGSYHWPAFNFADSAICIGVFLLIVWHPRHKH